MQGVLGLIGQRVRMANILYIFILITTETIELYNYPLALDR